MDVSEQEVNENVGGTILCPIVKVHLGIVETSSRQFDFHDSMLVDVCTRVCVNFSCFFFQDFEDVVSLNEN